MLFSSLRPTYTPSLVSLCLSVTRFYSVKLCGMDVLASPPGPDPSSLIASKLLQGWTLLADSCPVCLTPIVRNRQKQLFCVSCAQWLLTEDQLALKLQAQHVHDSPPASPAKPQASATANHMRVASQRDDSPSSDERSPKRQANSNELPTGGVSFNISEDTNMTAPPAGPSDHYSSDLPKVQSTVNPSDVLSKTLSTLYQKLEEIRQAIAACQDNRDLHQLLSTLGECMQAIQRGHSLVNA